ncbi:MAG: tyrosine-protein kinase domain-containing protein [Solirubrobacteraceae bacterium]
MKNDRPEATLADYLRSIRRHRLLILITAVVCAALGLGVSLLMKKTYTAQAQLTVRDPSADLTLLGAPYLSASTPLQLALAHVPQVTRAEVLSRVKATVQTPLTATGLRNALNVSVDPNSNLVVLSASASTARQAAAIANGFAQADASLTTAETRASYAQEAKQLNNRIDRLGAQDATTKAVYIDQLSKVQSLSSVATPVQLTSSATVPSGPTSPKPATNIAAALIFGLLLGVALAYARDALDRRLRRSADVERWLPHPIVGYIRGEALGHPSVVQNGGSGGRHPMAAPDEESFRILRQNVRYLAAGDPMRTVLITSAMAAEGKSTVAACLALANAAAGKRTLLVECDLRRPVLAARFGLAPTPGLTDYLTGNASPQEIMQSVRATAEPSSNGDGSPPAEPGLSLICIAAGTSTPRPAELLTSERFQQFISDVSQVYDTVILDSPPLLSVADSLELIPRVSTVLLCVRLEQTTRDQARAAEEALNRMPDRPTALVLTAVNEETRGYYGYYYAPATSGT